MTEFKTFNQNNFDEIPDTKGIYAFFLDFSYLQRGMGNSYGSSASLNTLLEKSIQANTLCKPKDVEINLYGRSKINTLQLSSKHKIYVDERSTNELGDENQENTLAIARVLARCSLLTTPLYVGITDKQTFNQRFNQHRDMLNQVKLQHREQQLVFDDDNAFEQGGKFPEKLAKRKIEFRDLLFVCLELTEEEIGEIKYLERFLQALINPPLSESN